MKVALIGGSGFVGTRIVEQWMLTGRHEPRLLVRGAGSLARAARFPLPDWRQTDVLDADALAEALTDCEAVVHAMVGTPGQITMAAEAVKSACLRSRVRRLVYLSSASVHGQNPPPGTNDLSPLRSDQPVEYNNAKVLAERALSASGSLEVAILRPGIVYGPRCQWFAALPRLLESGQAFLVEGGTGICNHIYVDNLVDAIECALDRPEACDGPYYVGDDESLTWRDFYRPVVSALGYDLDDVRSVPPAVRPARATGARIAMWAQTPAASALKRRVSPRIKRAVRAGVVEFGRSNGPSDFDIPQGPSPEADWETSELHNCRTRLSWQRATAMGYRPLVPAEEGLARTGAWLVEISSNGSAPGGSVDLGSAAETVPL